MGEKEFIKKMNDYNYSDEDIKSMLNLIEETKAKGIEIPYEVIILEKEEV